MCAAPLLSPLLCPRTPSLLPSPFQRPHPKRRASKNHPAPDLLFLDWTPFDCTLLDTLLGSLPLLAHHVPWSCTSCCAKGFAGRAGERGWHCPLRRWWRTEWLPWNLSGGWTSGRILPQCGAVPGALGYEFCGVRYWSFGPLCSGWTKNAFC